MIVLFRKLNSGFIVLMSSRFRFLLNFLISFSLEMALFIY